MVSFILPTVNHQLQEEKVSQEPAGKPHTLYSWLLWLRAPTTIDLSLLSVICTTSVGGFSLEFALLNPSGFFFYSVYSVGGRVNPNLGTGEVSFFLFVSAARMPDTGN